MLGDVMNDFHALPFGRGGRPSLTIPEPRCLWLMVDMDVAFAHEHENVTVPSLTGARLGEIDGGLPDSRHLLLCRGESFLSLPVLVAVDKRNEAGRTVTAVEAAR